MSNLRQAAEQALKQLQRDDVYLGHRSKTRADAIEALRQALVHDALDRMVAENQRLGLYDDKPPVKSYAGGKPNYCTPEVTQVGCAECGANGGYALYCVGCAEKFLGGIKK